MVGARVGIAFALAVALVGCSSSGDHTLTAGQQSGATPAKNTARVRIELPIDPAGDVDPAAGQRAVGAVRVADPYVVEGVVDFSSGVARFEQQSSPDGKKLSMLIAGDGSLYESPDPEGDGPSWVHFPADDAGSPRFGPTDPVAMVTDLRTAASSIDDAGKGNVEGDATSRYVLSLPNGLSTVRWFGDYEDIPIQATMDVDEQGRLRRVAIHVLPDATDTSDEDPSIHLEPDFADSTMSLWDFGVDVDPSPPSADDVIEFDENNPDPALTLLNPDWNDIGVEDQQTPELTSFSLTSGTWKSVPWQMLGGTNSDGDQCAVFAAGSGVDDGWYAYAPSTGVVFSPKAEDSFPGLVCSSLGRHNPLDVVDVALSETSYWYLAGIAAPDVIAVDLVAAGQSVATTAPDAEAHTFVFFDDAAPKFDGVRAQLTDGTSVVCSLDLEDGGYWFTCTG